MRISIIVPVYNRPAEVSDLLESLTLQTDVLFEVLIVEDGSTQRCDAIANAYKPTLDIQYAWQTNAGPGQARNTGCRLAKGDYFIFLDSDCVLPAAYIEN